jgi:hypothetical protein
MRRYGTEMRCEGRWSSSARKGKRKITEEQQKKLDNQGGLSKAQVLPMHIGFSR